MLRSLILQNVPHSQSPLTEAKQKQGSLPASAAPAPGHLAPFPTFPRQVMLQLTHLDTVPLILLRHTLEEAMIYIRTVLRTKFEGTAVPRLCDNEVGMLVVAGQVVGLHSWLLVRPWA